MRRYERHTQLPEVGTEGQQKLNDAKVLVVGAGGLGCPVLQYLAGAGVGTIGIVDADVVSLNNLHRQTLYTEADVGRSKAYCAAERLKERNSDITSIPYASKFSESNGLELVSEYDVIVDGTDNFEARYLINDACILANKPMVFGALYKFEGQVAVLNYKGSPTYRCLFPEPPQQGSVPTCDTLGVLSTVPGIIGLYQAQEVLKLILGIGDLLVGKVLCLDLLRLQHRTIAFNKREDEVFKIKRQGVLKAITEESCLHQTTISLEELNKKTTYLWVDVREFHEEPRLDFPNLVQMPLSRLYETARELPEDSNILFFCQSGIRSQRALAIAGEMGILKAWSLIEGASEIAQWFQEHTQA